MKARLNYFAAIFVILNHLTPAFSYDEVKIEKVVTFPDKKLIASTLKLDKQENIWILNQSNNALQQIAANGMPTFGFPTGKKGLFANPIDFDFFEDGSLAVIDGDTKSLLILRGTKEEETGRVNWKKTNILTRFEVQKGLSVAVSRDDIIAIGYDNQNGIDLFSRDGVLLHRLMGPEKNPLESISSLAFSMDGVFWALDSKKGVLHRFSADRKYMGNTVPLEGAEQITIDPYGYVYLTLSKGQWKEISPEGAITGSFGTKGKNPGEMLNPHGIAVTQTGSVWVSDKGNKRLQQFHVFNKEKISKLNPSPAAFVQVRLIQSLPLRGETALLNETADILLLSEGKGINLFDAEGQLKSGWKKKGKGTERVIEPADLTRDAQGQIWVSDQGDHSLKMVSESGDVLKTLGQKGSKEGSLKNPSFIRVRKDGSFVVVDKNKSRVQVLGPTGLFLFSLGAPGKKGASFENIAGVAVNDEMIVVLDDKRKALVFYSSAGKLLFEIANKEGKAPYWMEPVSLSSDDQGRFYLLDRSARRARVFNNKGQFSADFSASGNALFCGPNQKVLVLGDKSALLYQVAPVSKRLQNMEIKDESGNFKISWEETIDAKNYRIYRSSDNGNSFSVVGESERGQFVDNKLTPSMTYLYAIAGMNSMNYEGSWSLSNPIKASKRKDVSLVSIEKTSFVPIFTAAHKYYVTEPVGEIQVKNNDDIPHRNVKISLSLKNYTDFASETSIENLEAGELKTIPVNLTFNDKVLELTENTPVQLEIKLGYFEDNQEKSVSLNAPMTLYSRNAISWNDKARISSFITPRDIPIVEFARSAVRSFLVTLKGSTVGKPLAKAALLYESINALGISYVPDPKTPFSQVSGKPDMLDYVQFPRETLRRRTGDCDDTTALLSSLLESIGVQTSMVDTPGHIFLMANLEETDISNIGLPEERFVEYKGTYWVPIETTQLGKNFLSAWQLATSKIKTAQAKGEAEFIPVEDASKRYAPVTLVEADKETPTFPEDQVKKSFPGVMAQLQAERYEGQLKLIKDKIKENPAYRMFQVQLGMVHVDGGKIDEASKLFNSLLKEDEPLEVRAAAINNLGNISYLAGNYKEAAAQYEKASTLWKDDGGMLVNRARAAWKTGDQKAAKDFLAQAQNILPDWREYAIDIPVELYPK